MKKPTIKYIVWVIVSFVLVFILAFLCLFSILNLLYKFNIISAEILFIVSLVISAVIALVVILYVLNNHKLKLSKFRLFLSENLFGVILFAFILVFISVSIQPQIILEKEELKDFISLQWVIFGLSVTVFFVWEVIVSRLIKEEKPKKAEDTNFLAEIKFINEKKQYRENISKKYFLVFYLILNAVVLLFATSYIYIQTTETALFNQSLIISSFYICTNTFLQLLLDIIMPILSEKKEAFSDVSVTERDIDLFNKGTELFSKYSKIIEEIDKLPDLSDDIKQKIKKSFALVFYNYLDHKSCGNNSSEGAVEKDNKGKKQ